MYPSFFEELFTNLSEWEDFLCIQDPVIHDARQLFKEYYIIVFLQQTINSWLAEMYTFFQYAVFG